jgi:uncharacterized DUF497 family protein
MELIFDWDKSKASSNLRKHGVSFDEAKTIFRDKSLVTFNDEFHSNNEHRFISIGFSEKSRVLLVVHTEVDGTANKNHIRIISSRKATKNEQEIYEKG